MAEKSKVKEIVIPRIEQASLKVTIEGITTLISNRFSEEKKKIILDKQMLKAVAARGAKDPEALYKASIYYTEDGRPGFPASGIKKACVDVCYTFVTSVSRKQARGAFYIAPGKDILPIEGEPRVRTDVVRLKGPSRAADIRFRAEYPEWTMTFEILYSPQIISEEAIVNLLENAGFYIGIGDWRPERNGTHGMFRVAGVEMMVRP